MTKFVLFDLDNTLIDCQGVFALWANPSWPRSRRLNGQAVQVRCDADDDGFASRETVFEIARNRFNLDESVVDLTAEYRRDYPKLIEPDEGVLDALSRLHKRGIRVGIVTNGPTTQAEKIERAGLQPFVDGIAISQELGMEKPDPRIFAEAIRRVCDSPTRAHQGWMVGDSARYDMAGGRNVGLRTAWISRGRAWSEPEYTPDVVAQRVSSRPSTSS